ncbi:hypothetical protein [Haloferax sp. DFSO52]|uniref:hypothetical protein n=1 Tax=Haloferax sp. DFSO52 TaxID=3388505 RepID=UPI003A85E06E
MDALSLAESVWKPLVLPASFLLFLPVWALYLLTFPFAVVLSLSGIHSTQMLTLVVRGLIVFVGFPLSVVLQTLVISFIIEGFGSDSTNTSVR